MAPSTVSGKTNYDSSRPCLEDLLRRGTRAKVRAQKYQNQIHPLGPLEPRPAALRVPSWCATCTTQRPTAVYMLDPRMHCSDGAFHCESCWREHGGFRPERKEHVCLPATVCADCGEEKSPLHMEDQYNAKSDLQFRCESCWEKKSGGVPDKSAQYPVDTVVTNLKDIAFDGKPLRHLRVTDLVLLRHLPFLPHHALRREDCMGYHISVHVCGSLRARGRPGYLQVFRL